MCFSEHINRHKAFDPETYMKNYRFQPSRTSKSFCPVWSEQSQHDRRYQSPVSGRQRPSFSVVSKSTVASIISNFTFNAARLHANLTRSTLFFVFDVKILLATVYLAIQLSLSGFSLDSTAALKMGYINAGPTTLSKPLPQGT